MMDSAGTFCKHLTIVRQLTVGHPFSLAISCAVLLGLLSMAHWDTAVPDIATTAFGAPVLKKMFFLSHECLFQPTFSDFGQGQQQGAAGASVVPHYHNSVGVPAEKAHIIAHPLHRQSHVPKSGVSGQMLGPGTQESQRSQAILNGHHHQTLPDQMPHLNKPGKMQLPVDFWGFGVLTPYWEADPQRNPPPWIHTITGRPETTSLLVSAFGCVVDERSMHVPMLQLFRFQQFLSINREAFRNKVIFCLFMDALWTIHKIQTLWKFFTQQLKFPLDSSIRLGQFKANAAIFKLLRLRKLGIEPQTYNFPKTFRPIKRMLS